MALCFLEPAMNILPEFVGTIHIFLGPYRGNPIALYLRQEGESCQISPTIYPWNRFVGVGETINKAAADFIVKWKEGNLALEMYSGPHWEGGIKPEKPKPPPKPAAPPNPVEAAAPKTEATGGAPQKVETTSVEAETPPAPTPANTQTTSAESTPANPTSPSPAPSTTQSAETSGTPQDSGSQPETSSSPQDPTSPLPPSTKPPES